MSNNENKDEMNDTEFEELKNNKFKQQKLSAWRPVPTIWSTTITFIVFGLIFLAIGIVVLLYSNQIQEQVIQYDEVCTAPTQNCNVTIQINDTYKQPIMFYYQLDNFYQNHRRYVKSKSNAQLAGEINDDRLLINDDCDPVVNATDTGRIKTVSGIRLTADMVANPCGLIAKSLFNDTYTLVGPGNKTISIDETNIAWESDKALKYKLPTVNKYGKSINWTDYLWTNTTDEHFMVWMRPAGLPNFRKLWGRIRQDLEPGTYTMFVNSNYPVSAFKGKKYLVFSTVNAFGGKNSFLGISYIVVGSICILMAILFIIGYNVHAGNQKKSG